MNTLDVLRTARALIADEAKWATIDLCTPDGRFCALGAIGRVIGFTEDELRGWRNYVPLRQHPAVVALGETTGHADERMTDRVARFNDKNPHAVVLDLFDRTIAR